MTNAPTETEAIRDTDNIICGCASLSLATLRTQLEASPELSFENLLEATGAGNKCTACLLDLEYHFVEEQARQPRTGLASTGSRRKKAASPERTSLKQRVYKWLDGITPLAPYPFRNTMPVLYGQGIEQWLWVANHSMAYEHKQCAPAMRMELVIRDAEGRTVDTVHNDVKPDSLFRHCISAPLAAAAAAPDGRPGIGSVEIRRHGMTPGIRGTTRPQVEIISGHAACAVHSQALAGAGQFWFACKYRPQHERMFFSLVNGVNRSTEIVMRYPADLAGMPPIEHRIALPPHGAVLHEVMLPPLLAAALGDKPMAITWTAAAPHKAHAICATPSLDRFSIDHL